MKQYMKVGERGYYDKKRYRCVMAFCGCMKCDLAVYRGTPLNMCGKVLCKTLDRPDSNSVIFRLQPKYRKEANNG